MTPKALHFEQRFERWLADHSMRWSRLTLSYGEPKEGTALHHFHPGVRPRRTVLAIHGAGNDALFGWIGLFKRLLEIESQIFTLDLPGHGRHGQTLFDGRSALLAIGALLGKAERSLPAHAIGISLGGSLLLRALADHPAAICSAVMIVAPLAIEISPRAIAREIGPATLSTLWRERQHYGWTGLIPSFGSFKRELYPLRLADALPEGRFGYVESLNREIAALALDEISPSIDLPVLLIYGERDRLVPAEQGERLHQRLPRSELHLLPGETHLSTPFAPAATRRLIHWIEAHD